MDKRMTFGIAYGQRAPKSVCQCGHSGDGAHSDHRDTVQSGHGACKVKGCTCPQFSWAKWQELFDRALAKVR